MYLPPLLPRSRFVLVGAAASSYYDAGSAKTPERNPGVRYFRNPPPPQKRDDGPPQEDGRNNEIHNPLSEREQKAYLILAGLGCLPFLLLLLLIILTHSPLMAN